MSWLASLILFLHVPVLLLLLAGVLVGAWAWRRKHVYLLWLSGGLALMASAHTAGLPASLQLLVCGAGAGCMAHAMALRFARKLSARAVAAAAMCLLLAAGYFNYVGQAHSHVGALLFVGAVLAGILASVCLPVWHSAKRHRAEQLLQAAYLAFVFAAVALPWLPVTPEAPFVGLLMWLTAGGAALAIGMLACAWHDGLVVFASPQQRDALTGLLNRAGLEHACAQALSEQAITVVVVCDLDYASGSVQSPSLAIKDAVLRHFGKLLQSSLREGDWVARIGRQEFALLLRQVSLADAQVLLQRINASLAQQRWAAQPAPGALVASFGVTQVREKDSLTLALHRADVLLCQAKDEGSSSPQVEDPVHASVAVFSIAR